MAAYERVFQRYEKKYILNDRQYEAFVPLIEKRMDPDRYGLYTITNLYYDTDDYRIIRASMDKPVYKEKLRMRAYGVPKEEDSVFLELKKKYKGVVYKRRVSAPLASLRGYYENGGEKPPCDPQILAEIDAFVDLYRPQPKVYIAYDRQAYQSTEDADLRVTFDGGIRFRTTELDLTKGDHGRPILPPDKHLCEIKIKGAMPLWLSHELGRLEIFPDSFSKYATCYSQYIFKEIQTEGKRYA